MAKKQQDTMPYEAMFLLPPGAALDQDGTGLRLCRSMIERHGVAFRHTDETDFEKELAFERRVNDYARPKVAAA